MQERYRTDYLGEFIIVESRWSQGKKQQTREWVPNPIENHHISGRAVCIANDIDQKYFNHSILQRHRGGLLGSKKLQTYGTGNIAFGMRLDFVIENNTETLKKLLEKNYHETSIVYTSPKNCLIYPGQFYLLPHYTKRSISALLPYLAAFDGHKEVFLIGYNRNMPVENTSTMNHITEVFDSYPGVKFYLVGDKHKMSENWTALPNVLTMEFREFITYCDV